MPRVPGRYEPSHVGGEDVRAFVPAPLPPRRPALKIDSALSDRLGQANSILEGLDRAAGMVPSVQWFVYSFVRKEAVISSQIEGTQATLVDLLTYEASGFATTPDPADIEEVCNYVDALGHARAELRREKGLPVSMRLLNEAHRRLMRGVRGADKSPGEVRRSQNWIGGTRPGNAAYVPPPPHALGGLLGALERYIHSRSRVAPLLRLGLVHVQFESIHPYLDGNGRIGRLLVSLLLESWGLLSEPLLYLSLHFKRHQGEYYRRLNRVRTDGDFEGWLRFFLEGIIAIGEEARETTRDLFDLISADRARVLALPGASIVTARLFEALPARPIVTVGGVVKALGTTKPTATRAIQQLTDAGVLVEMTGRRRDRAFGYASYLERLRGGTDLPD